MAWTVDDIPDLTGQVALVTGANNGLGLETTKALMEKGARVIMACRSLERAEFARKYLLERNTRGKLEFLELDLADLEGVSRAVDKFAINFGYLNLLINNAGVMAIPRTLSRQGFEYQFAVNHLAHMALSLKLLPFLAKNKDSRVITITSGAQFMGRIAWDDLQGEKTYNRWRAYSQSKLANVMFALELESQLRENKISVSSLLAHPGLARTNLQPASLKANGSKVEAFVYKLMGPFFQSASMGALPQLHASTAPTVKGGEQYGPKYNFRGCPRLSRIAPFALVVEARKRLWKLSNELIEPYL